jgi:hypothetical protein
MPLTNPMKNSQNETAVTGHTDPDVLTLGELAVNPAAQEMIQQMTENCIPEFKASRGKVRRKRIQDRGSKKRRQGNPQS